MIRTQMVRRVSAVLLSALVVQAGGLPYFVRTAAAADVPRVLVLPFAEGEGAPARADTRFRALLEGELKSREAVSVAPLPSGDGGSSARPSAQPPAEALKAIESGQALLGDLKFDAAAGDLKRGIELLTQRAEAVDFAQLIDANVSLAVALFRMGDEDGAQKALFTVARVAPEYRLPDGRFPPIFVREFEKARRRAEKAVKGSLNVDGPPGATAFIDGRDLGMVPIVEDNLVAGTHYVKVEGTRGELYGEVVEVKSGTVRVKATFSGGPAASSIRVVAVGPVLDARAVEQAENACIAAGADFAVAGVVYRSGEHQLTAATAVFSRRHKGFVALRTYAFDEELLTANVEAFKLADEIADLTEGFRRPDALPLNLAKNAGYRVADKARANDVQVADSGPRRVVKQTDRPTLVPDDEGGEEVRAFDRASVPADRSTPADGTGTVKAGGPSWWVWAIVGVGVAAAAGGAYYGVSQATRPVTGTVTATW